MSNYRIPHIQVSLTKSSFSKDHRLPDSHENSAASHRTRVLFVMTNRHFKSYSLLTEEEKTDIIDGAEKTVALSHQPLAIAKAWYDSIGVEEERKGV
jgi:hypothetical protein